MRKQHLDIDGNELDRSFPTWAEIKHYSYYLPFLLFMTATMAFVVWFSWVPPHGVVSIAITLWFDAVMFMSISLLWWMAWKDASCYMYARRDHRAWEARRE